MQRLTKITDELNGTLERLRPLIFWSLLVRKYLLELDRLLDDVVPLVAVALFVKAVEGNGDIHVVPRRGTAPLAPDLTNLFTTSEPIATALP